MNSHWRGEWPWASKQSLTEKQGRHPARGSPAQVFAPPVREALQDLVRVLHIPAVAAPALRGYLAQPVVDTAVTRNRGTFIVGTLFPLYLGTPVARLVRNRRCTRCAASVRQHYGVGQTNAARTPPRLAASVVTFTPEV